MSITNRRSIRPEVPPILFIPPLKVSNTDFAEVACKITDLELWDKEGLPSTVRTFVQQPVGC